MKRKILSIESRTINYSGIGPVNVRIVVWCIPESETSRSYRCRDFGVAIFGAGTRSSKRRYFRKIVNISKSNPIKSIDALVTKLWNHREGYVHRLVEECFKGDRDSYGFTTAVYSAKLGGTRLEGEVRYVNDSGHYNGTIETSIGMFTYYRCNFKGANSPYASLVSNIPVNSGTRVSFEVPKDPSILHVIGAINLEIVNTESKAV